MLHIRVEWRFLLKGGSVVSKPASGLFHGTTGERAEENNKNTVSMPSNNAQLKHIFRDAPGHLPDTPKNRAMILELANDPGKYVGTDAHGNMWNVEMTSDGAQIWVRYRGGVINNAGKMMCLVYGITRRDCITTSLEINRGGSRNERKTIICCSF